MSERNRGGSSSVIREESAFGHLRVLSECVDSDSLTRVVTDDARLNGDFLSENWPTDAAEEFIEAVIILVW